MRTPERPFARLGLWATMLSGALGPPAFAGCNAPTPIPAVEAATACDTYLGQNGVKGTSCQWSFDYRAKAATDFADRLWDHVTTCGAGSALTDDALVNHPDSYGLRGWSTDHATYYVTVKDKAALGQTNVALRIEMPKSKPN